MRMNVIIVIYSESFGHDENSFQRHAFCTLYHDLEAKTRKNETNRKNILEKQKIANEKTREKHTKNEEKESY